MPLDLKGVASNFIPLPSPRPCLRHEKLCVRWFAFRSLYFQPPNRSSFYVFEGFSQGLHVGSHSPSTWFAFVRISPSFIFNHQRSSFESFDECEFISFSSRVEIITRASLTYLSNTCRCYTIKEKTYVSDML